MLGACLFLIQSLLLAQYTPGDLRKIARNPFAGVVKLPFESDVTFNQGPFHRTASDSQVQPVLPWQITGEWLLVTRVVADVLVYQPNLDRGYGGTSGLGDTTATLFLTPAETRDVIWGVGPALLFPTATDSALGSGKWGLGPSFVVMILPDWGWCSSSRSGLFLAELGKPSANCNCSRAILTICREAGI